MRSEKSDSSEQVSQLLFGEVVEIIEEQGNWLQVQSFHDGYLGWIDFKHIHSLREKEVSRWLDGLTIEHSDTRLLEGPEGRMRLTKGFFRPAGNHLTFSIGRNEYVFLDEQEKEPEDTVEFATRFLNAPYLWGGKSLFGIDCSGLMQLVHRYFDVKLPRDAYEQWECGAEVEYDDRMAGDLVFFINENQKIHHVGLLISPNEIIHAHGYVRIDRLTPEGIIRNLDEQLSHRYHGIKRMH
jgi:cell wall-associated NlpC family hydrolase